jgi:hypothetical protein
MQRQAMIALRVCAIPPQEGCLRPTLFGLSIAAGIRVRYLTYGRSGVLRECERPQELQLSWAWQLHPEIEDSLLCNAYSPCSPMDGLELLCSC